ncbi:MAG: hypothetical protein WCP86_09915, partial [bacterium]
MKKALLTALLVVLVGDAAQAASYGVNFDGVYERYGNVHNPIAASAVLGPNAANQANWNNVGLSWPVNEGGGGTYTFSGIVDSSGGNSISIDVITDNDIMGNGGSGANSTPFDQLYGGQIGGNDSNAGRIRVLQSQMPFSSYDLYVYSSQGLSVSVGGVGQSPSTLTPDGGFTSANTL